MAKLSDYIIATPDTKFQTGDILMVDSFVPLVDHFAMVVNRNGVQSIVENKFLTGGQGYESLEDYRKRRTITMYLRNPDTARLTDEYILKKANECSGHGYKFFDFNCEDLVRYIAGTDIGYDQRRKWGFALLGVILGGTIGFLIAKRKKWNLIGGIFIGALIAVGIMVGVRKFRRSTT